MSEPIELILKQNKQLLRLYCGQCGDSVDIVLEIDPENKKRIFVSIQDSIDLKAEGEDTRNLLTPVEIIV